MNIVILIQCVYVENVKSVFAKNVVFNKQSVISSSYFLRKQTPGIEVLLCEVI